MRLLKKLLMKLVMMVIMVVVMGGLLRVARPYIMKAAGVPEGMPGVESVSDVHFSSEESDLMATVFKSAMRLFSGTAKREELSSELSDKLYAGRADAGTMSELGIELVKPGSGSPAPGGLAKPGAVPEATGDGASNAHSELGAKLRAKAQARAVQSPADQLAGKLQAALLGRLWAKSKANPELALVPVVLLGMAGVHVLRRRRSGPDDFLPAALTIQTPAETETYAMKHAVRPLKAEDFELLVALIYQRQGYRVSMPAGLSGGRGGDFTLARKAEQVLVQCKNLSPEHKLPVERVRELREAMTAAGATRGMYVASCGFTWDARNYAKANGVTLINGRTLDALLTEAREKPDENLLAVAQWAPKLMSKVKLTPPLCPACEAAMEQLSGSNGSVWVCSQRPECRGRRTARPHHKAVATAAQNTAPAS